MMNQLPAALTDEAVERDQAMIRGQLVGQLSTLLTLCTRQLEHGEEEGHVDPRFAELQLRVLDRIGKVYRVYDRPREREEDVDPGISQDQTRELILQQLLELEARTR